MKLLKSIQQFNEVSKGMKQNGYYFMNSDNSKTPDAHRLLLNLSDKINLSRNGNYIALSNLIIYCTWKNIKKSYKI